MNKIVIGLILVAAVVVAWFILNPGDTFDYVVTVDNEITQLEDELASLDAQVTAGTLTEEQATTAKVSIVTRLNTIRAAASESEKATLTPAQRAQLVDGLDRLKVILVTYQGTLAAVEVAADDTKVEAELVRKGGSSRKNTQHLSLIVADVIESVEETVQDSVQDYEPNTELDAEIDVVVEETEAEVDAETEADMSDDEAMIDDEATTTDEATQADDMDDMGSDDGENIDTMDASISVDQDAEVSADADLDTTTTN